jgi:hypothetical protein
MLESFKRFFAHQGLGPDWHDVQQWAGQKGLTFKRAREDEGFVLDGALDGKPWRVEWGPPQRSYIDGRELRIRMELKLPSDMQMLLLSRPLMEQLERRTYEQFTEGMQTQIDTSTPEEMRWLVMFPKVDMARFRVLRQHFGVVAWHAATGLAWIESPLGQQLERAMGSLLNGDPPFVLMTLRGRTYLRVRLIDPDVKSIGAAIAIFEAAVVQAVKLASAAGEGQEWPSTGGGSTAWQSFGTDEPPR